MVLPDTVVLLSNDKYIMILSHKWGFCSKYYLFYVILSVRSFFTILELESLLGEERSPLEMIILKLGRIMKLQQKIAFFLIPTVEMVCQN